VDADDLNSVSFQAVGYVEKVAEVAG